MSKRVWILAALIIMAGCGGGQGEGTTPEELPTLTGPGVTVVPAPDAGAAAEAYLDAWAAFDYEAMYGMLTSLSQDAISLEEFQAYYELTAARTNLYGVDYDILQTLVHSVDQAQVGYRVILQSAVLGEILGQTRMNLSRSGDGPWQVVWDTSLILPELAAGNSLSLEREVPSRGIIYDRLGNAIAVDTGIVSISVIPSAVDEDDADGLVSQLATLLNLDTRYLSSIIFAEDADFLIALGAVSQERFNEREPFVSPYYYALQVLSYDGRLYPDGGAAPQATGYVGAIPADDVPALVRDGYQSDDLIGRIGIESALEADLAGVRGGTLYLINPEGGVETTLAQSDAGAAEAVYMTLERNLQTQAQLAMGDFAGAVVVLERDTGRVLAMVSAPDFNPNAADPFSPLYNLLWESYLGDARSPFFNRALLGQYPPGSIFKVIPMAAALESGMYTSASSLFCGHTWDRLATPYEDWTLAKELPPSGELTLQQGLMRSCNPWFYEIGYTLAINEQANLIAELARGFGLGSPTGIGLLQEEEGQIEDLSEDPNQAANQAVQQAIGQHTTLVTPIQAAVYAAALGNGGTLYQPQMIEYIEGTDGVRRMEFEAISNGELPISENTLLSIQTAMRMVVADPRGTAYRTFGSFPIQIAGKTGTASNTEGEPHAWFIGYTMNNNPDRPDIAIAVIVENGGEGSEAAAPIFRRLVEIYFFGKPQTRYPWEEQIWVVAQPDEEEEEGDDEGGLDEGTLE
ncbi:MAG: penicillin-binding transpeptidase domain-containing protein [Anaerolineae bacterium]|nr:penicillin-binding transpeptidase domain-containing protein [Anaerolineae bacterium]